MKSKKFISDLSIGFRLFFTNMFTFPEISFRSVSYTVNVPLALDNATLPSSTRPDQLLFRTAKTFILNRVK